jgi:cystathionine beta-lyase/cystathionine gamma-synthase
MKMTKKEFDELEKILNQIQTDETRIITEARNHDPFSQEYDWYLRYANLVGYYRHLLDEYLEKRIDENYLAWSVESDWETAENDLTRLRSMISVIRLKAKKCAISAKEFNFVSSEGRKFLAEEKAYKDCAEMFEKFLREKHEELCLNENT